MCNGSLDKWIFHRNQALPLTWQTKRKIILQIAQGLSYLHRDCRKTIIHFDIKPQNILLDGEFNAKVADFGLARFIETDQSHVLTVLKGTPGYWAPEWWWNKKITEKVDVYSFGVVVLEIMCGRKNVDHSRPEEEDCLLYLVKTKAEEDQLFDVIDKQSEDIIQHKDEAVRIIRTAISCLQTDSANRPSMPMVVNILEGLMDAEAISDYSFLTWTPMDRPGRVDASGSTTLLPETLSGPR
ncbi:G-type lectin S-receptor-like serine/threonine-protein kinase SD2-5 [Thalictrum thalictroides]|uniref:non-specific serine/threonine protein kinase n=1 Tax=Thalictrum thalictroides TaxID=46969 RepID=A0A7J6VWB5_THATH|nr:G-type lectin S-receptor-like serine/threonine-protein kinase SD2-5 [Thalictrum thalictroides]